MKRYVFFLMTVVMMCMTSCLEHGLKDLPVYENANITDFYFEYRYTVTQNGITVNNFMRLTNASRTIGDQTITLKVSIPGVSGTFTEAERAKVNLSNIVGYCYISTAATIEPVDGAPKPGTAGNFTAPVKYKVTAADGKTSKIWTINATMQ